MLVVRFFRAVVMSAAASCHVVDALDEMDVLDVRFHYFFETLVRVHRAGEGAPYTGLKAAGNVEPAVAAADKALETGSVDKLAKNVAHAVETAIKKRFQEAKEKGAHKDESVKEWKRTSSTSISSRASTTWQLAAADMTTARKNRTTSINKKSERGIRFSPFNLSGKLSMTFL
jgi:hypothetical protein